MAKNLDLSTPEEENLRQLWDDLNAQNGGEFKLMIMRISPSTLRGLKISGYLETFYLPTTIPDIIEAIDKCEIIFTDLVDVWHEYYENENKKSILELKS